MSADEAAVRELIQTWLRASSAGELDRVLALMSDDVVFLTPGRPPFGKAVFAEISRASAGKVRFEGTSEVQEVVVAGDTAYCRTHLRVSATPVEGGATKHLTGHTLSVLRKQSDGNWVMTRDANLLAPEPRRPGLQAAVPVFQVASVAKSVAWYGAALGFTATTSGPPEDPFFAILIRDGVELMLQHIEDGAPARTPLTELGLNAYLRVADVRAAREAILATAPTVGPIETRPYGCHEFCVTDPDGYVLVVGQCQD